MHRFQYLDYVFRDPQWSLLCHLPNILRYRGRGVGCALGEYALSWARKAYLRALLKELRDAGVLAADAEVASFEELLAALEGTSGVLADTVDVPPLNVPSVRTSWQELQRQAADLPDGASLERIFAELQLAARQEDRSILEISSMVALGAVRTGVRLGNVHVFDYYRRALRTIVEEGLLSFLRRTGTSYLRRAGSHFDPLTSTYSERLLRRRAARRSPMERQTAPQSEASDEEDAARG